MQDLQKLNVNENKNLVSYIHTYVRTDILRNITDKVLNSKTGENRKNKNIHNLLPNNQAKLFYFLR
jgi:hypothetical protein